MSEDIRFAILILHFILQFPSFQSAIFLIPSDGGSFETVGKAPEQSL
jgi:hypothetical protein